MSARASMLAPFRVRSFRFQWPADLCTSWAFEMETLILGWYVLVETRSVVLLTAFGALQYLGTLIAPVLGVLGDRFGARNVLCAVRASYATLAASMMTFALAGLLTPVHVFIIAALMGLVRPSDQVMRYSLLGATIPAAQLTSTIGIARTTQDTARIFGALAGAGLVATLGMGPTYAVVATLYAASFVLTLNVGGARPAAGNGPGVANVASPLRDLFDAVAHVRATPPLFAVMCLAFLLNFTAFPLVLGLMPYIAREIYHTDQTGLGYLVASFASGGLTGSILLGRIGAAVRPGRTMLVFCACWYVTILLFAQTQTHGAGVPLLVLAGCSQSLGMASMSALLLRTADEQLRSRVMGLRMLAIYGLPVGLLLSGPLIERLGYPTTAVLYCTVGLCCASAIALRWRAHLWHLDAAANRR